MRFGIRAKLYLAIAMTMFSAISGLASDRGLSQSLPRSSETLAAFAPGQVIVKFKGVTDRRRLVRDFPFVDSAIQISGLVPAIEQLLLKQGIDVDSAVASLMKCPDVVYAVPNRLVSLNEGRSALRPSYALPRLLVFADDVTSPAPVPRPDLKPAPAPVSPPVPDPDLPDAWNMAKVAAVEAWSEFGGTNDMIVANVDSGIDYNHEDLSFNLWRNPNPGPKNDIVGYDFVHDDGLPYDDIQHGTHTAGLIGAVGGNGKGISGVSPRVSLMSLKFLDSDEIGTVARAVAAIDYAVQNGARVVNLSWGGQGNGYQPILDAINAAGARGVLFIAAAGNYGSNNDTTPVYPASFTADNLISVASTDEYDGLALSSDYGVKTTQLAAPGTDAFSTVPGSQYAILNGTSSASPMVAGAAALVWGAHPAWNYSQVRNAILGSVDPLESLSGKVSTGGRLNVLNALRSKE